MRLISITVSSVWLWAVTALAGEPLAPPCLMYPPALSVSVPDSGFAWLPGGDFNGTCDEVPASGWSSMTSGGLNLLVYADGPAGSGRYWKVTVAVSEKQDSTPMRGVCVWTSTVGWRTLQRYSNGPLSWLDDVDDDGSAELILWDSFPLNDDASMAEYALVAWVYRLVSGDSLVVDWELSRDLARSLAKEYRSRLDATTGYPDELRAEAAEALEMFADGGCGIDPIEDR